MIHHHFTNDSRHAKVVIYAGAGNKKSLKIDSFFFLFLLIISSSPLSTTIYIIYRFILHTSTVWLNSIDRQGGDLTHTRGGNSKVKNKIKNKCV